MEEGKCAVSDNFHRRFRLGVGDIVELATPTGMASFPIAAVLRDFTSEIVTSLLISVAERRREIGILKSLVGDDRKLSGHKEGTPLATMQTLLRHSDPELTTAMSGADLRGPDASSPVERPPAS